MPRFDENPNLRPFGPTMSTLKRLTPAQEAELGPHERIAAVWPMLIQVCTKHANMLAQEGISVNAEDLLQEFALMLVERDHRWDHERGKYTTFVRSLWRCLRREFEERRTVVVKPKHAWKRLQKLQKKAETQELKRSEPHTLYALEAIYRAEVPLPEVL